jgi:hypothetical protein
MNTDKTNSAGVPSGRPLSKIAWPLATLALASCWAFLLSGCTGTPEIFQKPDELGKLPQWTQVALVLRDPLMLVGYAAMAWAVNGAALISKTIISKKVGEGE